MRAVVVAGHFSYGIVPLLNTTLGGRVPPRWRGNAARGDAGDGAGDSTVNGRRRPLRVLHDGAREPVARVISYYYERIYGAVYRHKRTLNDLSVEEAELVLR